MSSAETDAIMAVVIITLLLMFILAVFGATPTYSSGGVISTSLKAFQNWFQASRISM